MSRRFHLLTLLAVLLTAAPALAQTPGEFRTACDSIAQRLYRRTAVRSKISIRSVKLEDQVFEFRFTKEFSDFPWKPEDTLWFKEEFQSLFPKKYASCSIGLVYADVKTQDFPHLVTPTLSSKGRPAEEYDFRSSDPRGWVHPLVEPVGGIPAKRGLSGRHIALWQSHGRYFEQRTQRWEWQRAPTFRTCEDLFTQGFVLPYLIPMLENAGAVVMTPRERDTQIRECVVDNDPAFSGPRTGLVRRNGMYAEEGRWEDGGTGFADKQEIYSGADNPFRMGTYRKVRTVSKDSSGEAWAQWTADIPERGFYAVYVSYASLQNSTDGAHYTVRHLGGTSEFIVNQRMGGGTWVYLGTFEFPEGTEGCVTLDNVVPEGRNYKKGQVVTADAVRFGGGMGKVARGCDGDSLTVSGYPAYLEGALYAMQYAGFDDRMLHENELDYTNDYAKRGAWVRELSGGSAVNPKHAGRGIPFDLSLAFHTDAGVTPNDSIVGTLAIYTLLCDGKPDLADGGSRQQCRDFAALVQDQVVSDIRASMDSKWSRRFLWNRSYSESRTTGVPGMILELLSHQNFADMKYGLDPSFRFLVGRAVYKGALKFLSERYGCRYVVQPLPVSSFAVRLDGDEAVLSWEPVSDPLEPTAQPSSYRLYTRVDDGAFDAGIPLLETSARIALVPGRLYSFKVVAVNDGGASFPSEILCAGVADASFHGSSAAPQAEPSFHGSSVESNVLVVNNFTRVSAPAWFDTETYAGFDASTDSGVPYISDITLAGEQFGFRRQEPWLDDDCPGFGGSYVDQAGTVTPGNTFDFAAVHGRALLEAGYSVSSASVAAFCADSTLRHGAFALDLICGKQVTTRVGRGEQPDRFTVFPDALQEALSGAAKAGVHLVVSGARIGTDVWSGIYGDCVGRYDDAGLPAAPFVTGVLGYRWHSDRATRSFDARAFAGKPLVTEEPTESSSKKDEKAAPLVPDYPALQLRALHIGRPDRYTVDQADGLAPAADGAFSFLRYTDTHVDAAIAYAGGVEWDEPAGNSSSGRSASSGASGRSSAASSGRSSGAGTDAKPAWTCRYGAVSFGFPLEVLSDADLSAVLTTILDWFAALPTAL